jgi:AcrR family transcriptional regulator
MQRKSAILLAANAHFAHFGFRGASLRDIAREAGVSLTLLNHHFGSKFQLLLAVIDSHQKVLDDRSLTLRTLMGDPGGFGVRDVVAAWVRLGFETVSQPDGEMFMRLIARVIDDPEEEAVQVVREKLDDGALQFIEALLRCYPGASRYDAACAYQCFNGALLKFLIGSRRVIRLARVEPAADAVGMPFASASSSVADDPSATPAAESALALHLDPPAAAVGAADGAGLPQALADAWPDGAAMAHDGAASTVSRLEDQERLTRFVISGIEALMRA